MTILEQLATTTDQTLQGMIATRRRTATATTTPRMGPDWARKGTSWGKEGQFHKNR
ncbi:MAG: hypothetical protein JWQ81_5953 [Amycolatopsis sp.]|uniref:multiple cyclophane-containing RiPP AmcA n=1 Tax=Amycolatopsis sp. TaxID=37632 RepID=UPI00260455EE|nr:multiple cyclophane-containing RiPP AmcA [Amycolatopsis sp.]MCU1685214.1 hypothetical protein [Amycolatopsis sp.]